MADNLQTNAKRLILVDASGYIFRAYHAMPPMQRADGTPVGAVMGFCSMLLRLLDEARHDAVGIVFDAGRQNYRHDIYADYKANRGATPEDLVPQFAIVREATQAFGFTPLEVVGYEADDLIASYASAAVAAGYFVQIVSSDKDLMQLIKPRISLLDPIKFTPINVPEVVAKFGVTPDKVVDVQALAGDSSDNVPGVPGIGIKTAADLINEYGDLDTLLARAGEIKQNKRRESLIEHADKAILSRRLVQLVHDVPLPAPLENLADRTCDADALIAFMQAQSFRQLTSRVAKWLGTEVHLGQPHNQAVPAPAIEAKQPQAEVVQNYVLIQSLADLQTWVDKAQAQGFLSVDTETDSITPAKANLVGISMALSAGQACYIPVGHKQPIYDLLSAPQANDDQGQNLPLGDVIKILKPLLEDASVLKIAQNMKYDWQILAQHGINVQPIADTMVMSYVLDGGRQQSHGLDSLAQQYFDHSMMPYKQVVGVGKNQVTMADVQPKAVCHYAAEDADFTLRLWEVLKPRVTLEQKNVVYETLDKPLVPVLARMEQHGVMIDTKILNTLSQNFTKQITGLEKEIYQQTGQEFNLASPKQLGDVLFGKLALPYPGKKTKTGAYSTDAGTLEELSGQGHAVVDGILQWRQLAKLKSTYTDALPLQIAPRTGRVHSSLAQTITNTGRLSSTEPNLQNIPIRTQEGRSIRTAFVAPQGCQLLCVDYSQIELRLIAHMADIKRLQQAFHDGVDIHTLTASEVFGLSLENVTSVERRAAKAINFGIIYGISGFGLAKQLGCPNHEAAAYIKQYFTRFPELADYMAATKQFAHDHGYVETLYGRRCWLPTINSKNGAEKSFGERQAINAPIQGTAADIIKRAMIEIDQKALAEDWFGNFKARMLLQVHDELVFEVANEHAQNIAAQVKHIMENVIALKVPLVADVGLGDNWDAAH